MFKNRNMIILFFSMIVVMIGFGIIIPILPFYVESFGASSKALGLLMSIFSIMQFIFAPIWGNLSDRYGRKSILLIGVFGNALSQLLMGLSNQLWMLYASRALAGILSSATLPTAYAYISDTTDEKSRGSGMGVIGAATGVGMVLGPGIGGWLGAIDLSYPFYFAALLSTIAMVVAFIVLPESLPVEKRVSSSKIELINLKVLLEALKGPLSFLMFLAFMISFALTNFESIFGLYAEQRFGYGISQVGTIMTMVGLVSALIQGVATGPATRRWGESNVIKASLIGSAVGFVLMVLAGNFTAVLFSVGAFILANSMLRPSIASLISRNVKGSQGVAQGLNNSFMSLGRIIGPLWAGFLLDVKVTLPYLSGAVIFLLTFIASLIWLRFPRNVQAEQETESGAVPVSMD
ncbi:MAG: MFS transporter [Anaerolineaceae bacterium]